MSIILKKIFISFYLVLSFWCSGQVVQPLAQYPSPMQEHVRKHERVSFNTNEGTSIVLDSIFAKPVTVYIPKNFTITSPADLLIHFHGTAGVVAYAAENYKGNLITAIVNLGTGSGVYATAFNNDFAFQQLQQAIWMAITKHLGQSPPKGKIILSGFSAGYGAIRSILSQPSYFKSINSVLLLDGLHTSYIPERKVLAEGGIIDSTGLQPFIAFAKIAASSAEKKFLFTHSEIFPGTFVSTTEAAHYLLDQLGIKAVPVLKWGPGGMQQISEAIKGSCMILGFAGNSAPDHVDHAHNLYYFLNLL